MIRMSSSRSRPVSALARGGFTLVELLVVIIVIAILLGLLLPVIAGAMRTARQAAVQAEISQLGQAMGSFRSTYGDYPPSRVLLVESGNYAPFINSNAGVSTIDANASPSDTTVSALAQRSLTALRKFFPKVVLSTSGQPPQIFYNPPPGNGVWYDFNGNGVMDGPYILHGHECLVFFLGGVPFQDPKTGYFGMTGFGRDPVNPFSNSLASDPNYGGHPNPMYSGNRQSPLFEFVGSRLYLDPNNVSLVTANGGANPGIPGYYDTLGNSTPTATPGQPLNFYAYFSAYGNGAYDPNDVNFWSEQDTNLASPIWLQFFTATSLNHRVSPAPNPYTTSLTVTPNNVLTYEKAQTFQIFSPGIDGLYGVGGQYVSPSSLNSSASTSLPVDATDTFTGNPAAANTDSTIRQRERDNLTNFQQGTLQ
jgi:prepilin-type N-terminal cleavage/methylation domain-containing protein